MKVRGKLSCSRKVKLFVDYEVGISVKKITIFMPINRVEIQKIRKVIEYRK